MAWVALVAGLGLGLVAGWVVATSRRRPAGPTSRQGPVLPDGTPQPAELLEALPTGVVVSDRDGEIRYRNAAARSIGPPHVAVLLDDAIRRHLARGRAGLHSEETVEVHGPPTSTFVVQARPLAGGGSIVHVDDVSERRRVAQVRTDFVANISHELKTPIGALSVLAEAVVDETDPEVVRRVVDRMQHEADRASRTVDDLMELSRIELGGERAVERVNIGDVVHESVGRVEELAARSGIEILVRSDRRPELDVEGDRRQLLSAIGNLIENAVKYSEHGDQVLLRTDAADGWVDVTVEDHGVGIPQADLDRIFERFYRVDRARSRQTGGTGLGLSIVRHVATNHGGEIRVSSTEGIGSTFVLRLPHHPTDRSEGAE